MGTTEKLVLALVLTIVISGGTLVVATYLWGGPHGLARYRRPLITLVIAAVAGAVMGAGWLMVAGQTLVAWVTVLGSLGALAVMRPWQYDRLRPYGIAVAAIFMILLGLLMAGVGR